MSATGKTYEEIADLVEAQVSEVQYFLTSTNRSVLEPLPVSFTPHLHVSSHPVLLIELEPKGYPVIATSMIAVFSIIHEFKHVSIR